MLSYTLESCINTLTKKSSAKFFQITEGHSYLSALYPLDAHTQPCLQRLQQSCFLLLLLLICVGQVWMEPVSLQTQPSHIWRKPSITSRPGWTSFTTGHRLTTSPYLSTYVTCMMLMHKWNLYFHSFIDLGPWPDPAPHQQPPGEW